MTESANAAFAERMGNAHEADHTADPGGEFTNEQVSGMDAYNNITGRGVGLRYEGNRDGVIDRCREYALHARLTGNISQHAGHVKVLSRNTRDATFMLCHGHFYLKPQLASTQKVSTLERGQNASKFEEWRSFPPSFCLRLTFNDMSLKTSYAAVTFLKHDPYTIRQTLLDIGNLPAWNPVFSHAGPADSDGTHPVTIRNLLKGKLIYTQPTPDIVRFQLKVPGLTAESTFSLSSDPYGTKVTHTVNQRGFLTAIIGDYEASLVPHKRLARLTHALNTTHTTFPHE